MARYALGLGANVGDSMGTMRAAVGALAEEYEVVDVSSLYITDPIGGPDQDRFLNAVVLLETSVTPEELLDRIQAIEARFGRFREVRWGPRTLDLDILSTDLLSIASERLVIPHPRAAEREFVLRPLCDVWPLAPVGSSTAEEALCALTPQGVELHSKSWLDV